MPTDVKAEANTVKEASQIGSSHVYMIELIIWKLVWKVYNNQNQLCEISQFSFSDKNINKPSAEANVAIVRPTPPAIKAELGQQQ